MSGSCVKGVMWVPRNDREFVQQAARPIDEVLGEEESTYTQLLQKDHAGIAEQCKKALVPHLVPKTNRDYAYSMLSAAVLAAGGAAVYILLKSGSYKTVLIGAVLGMIVGAARVYFDKEVDLKEQEIKLKAQVEKNWLKLKQPGIEIKLKEAEAQVAALTLENFDANEEVVRTRDQLLLLKSYVETAVGRG